MISRPRMLDSDFVMGRGCDIQVGAGIACEHIGIPGGPKGSQVKDLDFFLDLVVPESCQEGNLWQGV